MVALAHQQHSEQISTSQDRLDASAKGSGPFWSSTAWARLDTELGRLPPRKTSRGMLALPVTGPELEGRLRGGGQGASLEEHEPVRLAFVHTIF